MLQCNLQIVKIFLLLLDYYFQVGPNQLAITIVL